MNPIKEIVDSIGKPAYKVLEDELDGIVSNATFFGLLDERGIPAKTQWETIQKVTQALGYEIVFQRTNNNA